MNLPRIPVENWSDRELEEALTFVARNNPETENPTQTVREIVEEYTKRGLNAYRVEWT